VLKGPRHSGHSAGVEAANIVLANSAISIPSARICRSLIRGCSLDRNKDTDNLRNVQSPVVPPEKPVHF
jgi:hypothetical protein